MFGAMLMRLAPLLDLTLWGSDWGEYFHLVDRLVEDGQHADRNLGWGRAYVDFPGLFDLAGAAALVTGLGTTQVMTLVVPCVSAISCLMVACIVLRLGGNPWAAVVSAGTVALLFPIVFTNSHPVPGALGSVLVMGVMTVFLMGDVWRRDENVDAERPMVLFVLMLLLLLALTVTHHLSLFFVIIVLGLASLLRSLLTKGMEPERAFWGFWSLTAALALASVYWLVVASTFREEVMVDLAGVDGAVVMALGWAALVVLVLLCRYLALRDEGVPSYPHWGTREIHLALVAYVAIALVVVTLVAVYGFPGTDIEPGADMLIYVLPTVAVFALLIGSTDVTMLRHGGVVVIAWVGAILGSFMFSTLVQSGVLVPYRHIPYIAEAAAVLIGIGAVHMVSLRGHGLTTGQRRRVGSRTPVVVIAALLVIMMAATAYPPKAVMGGFQEGTTESEVAASIWLRDGLPAPGARPRDPSSGAVVSDHRLSSMAFGIGGQMATWDEGGPVLHGGADGYTWAVMEDIDTPHGDRMVTAVVLSEDFRTGAALSQVDSPRPVEGEAWDKFFAPPFLRIYDGGDVWVMYAVRPLDADGES